MSVVLRVKFSNLQQLNSLQTVNKRTMMHNSQFTPHTLFNERMAVFTAPQKYIQGPNVLAKICNFLPLISSKEPIIIASKQGKERMNGTISSSFEPSAITPKWVEFLGECSTHEVNRLTNEIKQNHQNVDAIIGIGGGKLVDTAKFVAQNLNTPLMVCPTLASNDAPCSSLSIMYSEAGESQGAEYFKCNPNLVVVDSSVILNSPLRTLVAGLGDAMATYYEAEICLLNPKGKNMIGARPTLAAIRLAELCRDTLFAHSIAAIESMKSKNLTPSFEHVIEANTLLSGLGFESGGLAAAHSIAQALTLIPHVENNIMHGEMVAIGLATQLILCNQMEEAEKIANYHSLVGLPVHFKQLHVDIQNDDLAKVIDAAVNAPPMQNMPFTVTTAMIQEAFKKLNVIGEKYLALNGDKTFIPHI